MSATYALPLSTNIHRVRLLIGDTDTSNANIEDEEIAFFLEEEANIYMAGAAAAVSIARKLQAGLFEDRKVGETRLRTKRVTELLALAEDLRNRGRNYQLPSAMIYDSDKQEILDNDSLLPGSIEKGMHDYPGATESSRPEEIADFEG